MIIVGYTTQKRKLSAAEKADGKRVNIKWQSMKNFKLMC